MIMFFVAAAIISAVCVLWWMIKSEKGGIFCTVSECDSIFRKFMQY